MNTLLIATGDRDDADLEEVVLYAQFRRSRQIREKRYRNDSTPVPTTLSVRVTSPILKLIFQEFWQEISLILTT